MPSENQQVLRLRLIYFMPRGKRSQCTFTLNEWKELCTCQYDLMMEGNTNSFEAGTECPKKLKIGEFKE